MVQTGGEILFRSLIENRINLVTGVPGGPLVPFINAIRTHNEPKFQNIVSTHETLATLTASTLGRFNRWPGVAYVSRKGGADNATLGITQAQMHGDPLIVIVGQKPPHLRGPYDIQTTDIQADFAHRVKRVITLNEAGEIPEKISLAIRESINERPGVVLVEAPEPVLATKLFGTIPIPTVSARNVFEPETYQVKAFLNALRQSRKPLVIVGHMAMFESAQEEVKIFVKAIGAMVLLPFRQENLYPWHDVAFAGSFQPRLSREAAMDEIIQMCDSLFILGDAFNDVSTGQYTLFRDLKTIVHCYPLAGLAKTIYPQKIDLTANLQPLLQQVNQALAQVPQLVDETWRAKRQEWHAERLQFMEGPNWPTTETLDMPAIWRYLATFPQATYIRGAGNYDNAHVQYLRTENCFGTFSGDMGYALGAVLGLSLMEPYQKGEKMAVALAGDGEAGMFLLPALLTARQYHLPAKFLVFNDGQYTEIAKQIGHSFGMELSGADLFGIGEAKVADIERVSRMDQVKAAIQSAYQSQHAPYVIEFNLVADKNR
jgi:thiamine pyrophosphate-dependent acetolactate synthase large subunit-like protein